MNTRELLGTDLTPIYDEVANFLASAQSPQQIADYHLSPEADRIIADLLDANRMRGLTPDEQTALDEYTRIERLMQAIKLRAYARLA
jgi:hypothetical protein